MMRRHDEHVEALAGVGCERDGWRGRAFGEQRRLRRVDQEDDEKQPGDDDHARDHRTPPLTSRRTSGEPDDAGHRVERLVLLGFGQGSGPAPPRASMSSGCASTVASNAATQQLAVVMRDRSGVAPMVKGVSSPASAYMDATSRTTGTATAMLAASATTASQP